MGGGDRQGVNALVLAGAGTSADLRDRTGADFEALMQISGRPMVLYVLDALLGAARIDRIVAVGPRGRLESICSDPRLSIIDMTASLLGNLLAGAGALPAGEPVLVVSGDIPLLTSEMVDWFVLDGFRNPADLHYPIIEKSLSESRFPGARRTYVPTRDGRFTGGNLALLSPGVIERCARKASSIIEARKSPLKIASILGWSFILKLLLNVLTVKELERKISSMFELKGRAVRCIYPEIGMDVDKPADFDLVESTLVAAGR